MHEVGPTLSIVIPALNEEIAIGRTIESCLDARSHLAQAGPVQEIEVVVVSDGSTDHTEEIAKSFSGVTVLAFERNRGYGAAIKAGFEHARGELLGFLDADGTCDPRSFADLCRVLEREGADVAIGCRMGPQSKMPLVRVLGNALFAWILGLLSKRSVVDTASGMRVVRRSALEHLHPLPDGLHFTPAMTARVLLEGKLRIAEVPIPYAERIGRSKLSVVRDGLRFLQSIIQAAMCYQPARPLLLLAAVSALAAAVVGFGPTHFYLRLFRLEEWMIYRILLASLLLTIAMILAFSAVVADRVAAIAHGRPVRTSGVTGLLSKLLSHRIRLLSGFGLTALAVATVWPGIVEYAGRGEVHMHWSRAVVGSLLVILAAILGVTVFLLNMMDLIAERRVWPTRLHPPDRIHTPRE